MKLYVILEDWAINDEENSNVLGVYDSLDKAKQKFQLIKDEATADGLAFPFIETEEDTEYVTYTDGMYEREHYRLTIIEKELNK